MEITCPHCNQHGIAPKDKFFAFPKLPAKCDKCGELSAFEQGLRIKLVLIATGLLMPIGPAIYALTYPASILFMALPLVTVLFMPVAIYYLVPLAPVTTKEINHASSVFKITLLLAVIYLIYRGSTIVQNL